MLVCNSYIIWGVADIISTVTLLNVHECIKFKEHNMTLCTLVCTEVSDCIVGLCNTDNTEVHKSNCMSNKMPCLYFTVERSMPAITSLHVSFEDEGG